MWNCSFPAVSSHHHPVPASLYSYGKSNFMDILGEFSNLLSGLILMMIRYHFKKYNEGIL